MDDFVSGWEPEEELLESATLYVEGYDDELTVRMYAEESGILYRLAEDGSWQRVTSRSDGQYLVFTVPNGASFVLVRAGAETAWLPYLLGGGAVAVLAGLAVGLAVRGRKRKKAAETAAAESTP